jgi:hypothetical protein
MFVRSTDNPRSGQEGGTDSLANTFITATSSAQLIPGGLNARPDHSSSTKLTCGNSDARDQRIPLRNLLAKFFCDTVPLLLEDD